MTQPIDIPIPVDLQELMQIPECFDLRLDKPVDLSLHLPTGAVLKAMGDVSKAVPTDCALAFNLLLQLGPLLASMECLLKILKLLKPLVDVIKGLPFPPVKAIQDFADAAADLIPCFGIVLPTNLFLFIHDILCLIAKILRCIAGGLKTLIDIMSGLALQLKIAVDSGNADLVASLECAQENAAISAEHLNASMEAIAALLALVEPIMGMAGLDPFKLPALGKETDVKSLKTAMVAITGIADSLEAIALPLGGPCS